ncbi:MAG TPA: hypothetical protein VNB22_18585 [Pyrinomonadaceae bacterium]|nr:hypothetical protein [Pyrinomonadaceae bacterium]
MRSILISVFLICFVFCFSSLAQKTDSANSAKASPASKVKIPNLFRPVGNWIKDLFRKDNKIIFCPPHPWIDKITLSRPEISLSCLNYYSPCRDKSALIEVFAEGGSYQNEPFVYKFQASAGKIIGSGARVVWDLSGVQPGTFYVTAYAEELDYQLTGITRTEFVTIVE